tara:strand:- start:6364 stop:9285 length:2922 start_codon:yes stop_codon:yes gene_type:complete
MPISYNSQPLIPAPFVNISKEYIKTGDGKKVGATYTISIEGTLIPEKGSPNSTGAFSAKPSDENITIDDIQYSLFNKASAIRLLMATEGKRLDIRTWKKTELQGSYTITYDHTGGTYERMLTLSGATWPASAEHGYIFIGGTTYNVYRRISDTVLILDKEFNPGSDFSKNGGAGQEWKLVIYSGIYCYPRITGVEIADNRYSTVVPYTVNFEVDEVFHTQDLATSFGEEDIKKAGINVEHEGHTNFHVSAFLGTDISDADLADHENEDKDFADNKIYISDATDNWSIDSTSEISTPGGYETFTASHTVSATGKRAFGPEGLIRSAMENAKMWASQRIGINPNTENYVYPEKQTPNTTTEANVPGVLDIGGGGVFKQGVVAYTQSSRQVAISGTDSITGATAVFPKWAGDGNVKIYIRTTNGKFSGLYNVTPGSLSSDRTTVTLDANDNPGLTTTTSSNPKIEEYELRRPVAIDDSEMPSTAPPGFGNLSQYGANIGIKNWEDYSALNATRSLQVDDSQGSYSVTENWQFVRTGYSKGSAAVSSGSSGYGEAITITNGEYIPNTVAGGKITFQDTENTYELTTSNPVYYDIEHWSQSSASIAKSKALRKDGNNFTTIIYLKEGVTTGSAGSSGLSYKIISSNVKEDFTIDINKSGERTEVSINGTLTGFYERSPNYYNKPTEKYDAAKRRYEYLIGSYDPWKTASGVANSANSAYTTITYSGHGLKVGDVIEIVDIASLSYNSSGEWDGITTSAINALQSKLSVHKGSYKIISVSDSTFEIDLINKQIPSGVKWRKRNIKDTFSNYSPIYKILAPYFPRSSFNPLPITETVGVNPLAGTVSFSLSFDDRPETNIEGAISETISISDTNPTVKFATIEVPGRVGGPVFQNLGTTSVPSRTVNMEVVMPPKHLNTSGSLTDVDDESPRDDVETVLNYFENDLESRYSLVFITADQESWEPWTGRYTRSITWQFQNC